MDWQPVLTSRFRNPGVECFVSCDGWFPRNGVVGSSNLLGSQYQAWHPSLSQSETGAHAWPTQSATPPTPQPQPSNA